MATAKARKTTPRKSVAKKRTAATTTTDESPESSYVAAAVDAASGFAEDWQSAGDKLVGQLQTVVDGHSNEVQGKLLSALEDAAKSNDIAEYLRAHEACINDIQTNLDKTAADYESALSDYSTQLETIWKANQERTAELFTDYLGHVSRELAKADNPAAAAQHGWSLLAASQVAAAMAPHTMQQA